MNIYKKITKEEFDNRNIRPLSDKDKNSVKRIVDNFRNYFVTKHI